MNDNQYNELEGIRRSDLWVINKTPAHFKYNIEHPQQQTESLLFGSAMHKHFLELSTFYDEYAIMQDLDRRTKAGKEAYQEFIKINAGKTVISQEMLEQIQDMTAELVSDDYINDLLKGSIREQAYTLVDPETQEVVKVKADIITKVNGEIWIVDYKTTSSCEERAFYSSAKKYGYSLQAGMYSEIIEANLLETCNFAFIAQEKTAPYLHRVFICDKEFVNAGRKQYHDLLRLYHNCKVNDIWPGYPPTELLEEVYQ